MPVKILPATGAGSVTVQAENAISSDFTLTLPGATGTVLLNNTANNQSTTAPTVTTYTSGSGTYTVPAGVRWLRVRMVGAGGGGQGGGSTSGTNATAGGATTFGSSFLTCNGGGAVTSISGSPDLGGSATIGAGATGLAFTGAGGWPGTVIGFNTVGGVYQNGGTGGGSPFGGNGVARVANSAGLDAKANTGSGGGGGGTSNANNTSYGGSGGSAGGYIDCIISAPGASYSYAVGAGGNGGGAGTNGFAGGAGAAGIIIIEAHYNF